MATYVTYKLSLGMRLATEARALKSFSKSDGNVDLDRVGSLNRSARICIASRNQSKVERAAEAMVAVLR